ncbi:TolC family protein [Sphingobacterium alkalisoli]|uniref:TolC family protein n=1 Tax=Sphingobacterium alkalisoli TaxID=1874115 RepID=A0A4U0GTZ8_9SPHI|nr:TolC family protein [Sphingobacterium alkalisoli]TJY62531.1 TolC family protein [Sphingobacterium alkalisoli]GGH28899.1 membrane protein [Sphingobacterium alkalisoli]
MNRIVSFIFLFFFIQSLGLKGQEVLMIKEAVEIALENNYDIRLSKNDFLIAQQNVSYGNAGMLPSVTGNFTQNNSLQNSTQVQATGDTRSLNNAKNNNMNYGVSIGWTIFDGLGMFSRYDQLKELEKQGDFQFKQVVITRVSDVIATYYTLVEQQNLLNAIDSSIIISKERLEIAENRFSIGKVSRLEVLNVQVNLNTDESNRLRQADVVKNLKINLNSLLARDLLIDFVTVEEFEFDESLQLATLFDQASTQNLDLQIIAINKRIAELELKNVQANRYPTVRLNTGYNFSESESSLGFVSSSTGRGLTYGITASINIFDGFNQRRNERIAKIQVDNADLLIRQQKLLVETSIATAYQTYQTNIALVVLEEKNENIARQNLHITLEKYRIGSISTVEFRDAQENFINAVSRFNSAKLQAKLSEVAIKELIGQIAL